MAAQRPSSASTATMETTCHTGLAAEILIIAGAPVVAARREYVRYLAVLERFHGMLDVRRDGQRLSRANNLFSAIDDESQRSLFDHRHLLVEVTVLGDHSLLLEPDARNGHIPGMDHLASEAGVQLFFFNGVPVVKSHRGHSSGWRARSACYNS
jgi:hypothetical protein